MKVKTTIPFMLGRIAKEDTRGGTRRQFMRSRNIRVAKETIEIKVRI